MGIRVVCPNGHRLNLKSHLAGRHGLCPQCGARFRIPEQSSDVPLEAQPRTERTNEQMPSVVANSGAESSQEFVPATGGEIANEDIERHGDFSPQTVWYVQATEGDKAGDRFGPASGDLMQAWIAEGRILPNYLVWRDGWSDWRPGSILTSPENGSENAAEQFVAATPLVEESGSDQRARGRATRSTWKPAIVILLVLVGLVIAVGVGLAMMTGQIGN